MSIKANSYLSRGVSPTKDEVHAALKPDSFDLEPGAFCKLIHDFAGDPSYCVAMHADGAGTKSALAYLYYKETGDVSVFKGIAQDAIVMNIDDLACVGAVDKFIFSNTIGRNAHRVDGRVLKQIVDGYESFSNQLKEFGIDLILCGGETADVGDLVSTIIVDSTVYTRILREKVINCKNIRPGDVIVGFASDGQASYETTYNSGMGSNGLTASRHMLLHSVYAAKYPETYSPTIEPQNVYSGPFLLEDILPGTEDILPGTANITVGKALLSPTRTYLPVLKGILTDPLCFESVHGIIHNTGGGQIKCKKFGQNLHYIKNNLFHTPPLFRAIQKAADNLPLAEMVQIFNMGHRMEVYCDSSIASKIIHISEKYHIDAKIVGHVLQNDTTDASNKVTIEHNGQTLNF